MVSMGKANTHHHVTDLKIFIKDVRDRRGKKRSILVRPWSTIKDVKDQVQKVLHIPPSSQRLYFGPLIISNKELPNYRTLHDAGIYQSGETLLLDIKGGGILDDEHALSFSFTTTLMPTASDICISSLMLDDTPRTLQRIVQQARQGLALGLKPELVLDGTGGTYFLHDARKARVAVFKPGDEEPYAENNPRGYVRQGIVETFEHDSMIGAMREGINPGESCLREVAAYLLDHGGFAGVPMTTLAEARHPAFNTNGARLKLAEGGASMGTHSLISSNVSPQNVDKKVGSVQEFVRAECSMDDLSPSKLSVDEVHKIAILDIRLMNADRNAANLLCRRNPDNSLELVPIDHGYCLRTVVEIAWFDWCWLDWPQLKKPLSKKSKEYILNLDIERDVQLLKERLNLPAGALDNFRASSKLLKVGVEMGLRLFDIAMLCCRYDNEGMIQSKLEKILLQAGELSLNAVENGKWHHTTASRAIEEQLKIEKINHQKLSSVTKAKSMIDFSSLAQSSTTNAPSRMMTSGSESSFDAAVELDLDRDDCEQWAASIVADVQIGSVSGRDSFARSRASSFGSNILEHDQLSCSPKGFWHVRPGSNEVNDEEWLPSPSSSPKQNAFLSSFRMGSSLASLDDELIKGLNQSCTKPVVNYEVFENLSILPSLKQPITSIVRSHSYAALSSRTISDNTPANFTRSTTLGSVDEDYKQHHVYFLKFIDLLIERETRLASLEVGSS